MERYRNVTNVAIVATRVYEVVSMIVATGLEAEAELLAPLCACNTLGSSTAVVRPFIFMSSHTFLVL
jgi:hypothetical protein